MWRTASGTGPALAALSLPPYLCGVFPFSVEDGQFRLSRPRLALSALTALALVLLALRHLAHPSAFYSSSGMVSLIYWAELLSCRAAHLLSLLWPLRHRSSLRLCAALLARVDLFLATNGYFLHFRISYLEDALALALVLALAVHHLARRTFDLWQLSKIFVYYFPMVALLQVTTHFRRWVSLLSLGFRKLRISLAASPGLLERSLLHFDYLYTAAGLLDHLFGPQALLIVFTSFLFITANLYFTICILTTDDDVIECIIKTGWAVVFGIIGYNIVGPSKIITKEAKEFNTLLYQLMIDDKTEEIANNKKLRLHIAMKREIIFTACGFFTLDYTLVHSMIGAATTYLVILIQFGTSNPSATPGPVHTTPEGLLVFTNATTLPTIFSPTP